ncbi:hypothetical protein [Bradyrhizobium sp. LHD-71]|uniref:hypothetical protein n=1 Tax=Bradyrhizobium sp. LHD-71 TaxID=3072141 RepID=UPI00280F9248|nr:hypothetical protein [Bradyrhizobium sp. LHD-71]MDQ8729444.1 hypothetical protein [Bradyrhizobium sp. LHD-71]
MKAFEFSVIASGLDPSAEDFEARFYEAGCDDALIAFQKGHIIVDFAREAATIYEAVASAVENVLKTGARVDRIEPDPLVNLTDIAARSKLTRQAISNYAKGTRKDNFPAPVARVTSETPLYDWSDVSHWLAKEKKIDPSEAIFASVVKEANDAIESGETRLALRLKKRAEEEERALEAA